MTTKDMNALYADLLLYRDVIRTAGEICESLKRSNVVLTKKDEAMIELKLVALGTRTLKYLGKLD